MNGPALVVQARMGATRLPGKVLLPFHADGPILGILLDRLQKGVPDLPVIVATSTAPADDPIAAYCLEGDIPCHRGSEEDVLDRFLGVAAAYELGGMVRICADNPFLDIELLSETVETGSNGEHDYVSHRMADGLPTILSHLGLFAEYVGTGALSSVARATDDLRYREHVTRWIYEHPGDFDILWLDLPKPLAHRTEIRLTVDDRSDLEVARLVYGMLRDRGGAGGWRELLEWLDGNPSIGQAMREGIERNLK